MQDNPAKVHSLADKPVPFINLMFTHGFAAESKHTSNHTCLAKIVTVKLLLCTMPNTSCALMCTLALYCCCSPKLGQQIHCTWKRGTTQCALASTAYINDDSLFVLSISHLFVMLSTSAKLVEPAVHLILLTVCRTYGGCSSTSWQHKWQVSVLSDTPPEHPSPFHKQQ